MQRARGQTTDGDPLDAHELFVRSKVAALLALLDGRRDIGADDWTLAAVMWATSCAVRERVVAHGRGLAAAKAEAATEASVERAVRTAAEVTQVEPTLARIAALLAAKVGEHGALTHGAAHRLLAGRDRGLYRAAVEHGVTTGLLARSADGITAGGVRGG